MAAETHPLEVPTQAAPQAAPACRLVGVGKCFGPTWACRNVDLTLRPGEVHALLGENGAGKSTLLKILHGLYRPDEGYLEVAGERRAFASPREAEEAGIAIVPQELDLFPDLTVAENLFVGRERPRTAWGGFAWKSMQRRAADVLQRLGVEIDVRALAHTLPGASAQMVEIARALLREAPIVLFDEPTAALTDRETGRLFAIIRLLKARGVAVIYISHRLEEITEIADTVTVMRDGTRVYTGPAQSTTPSQLVQLMIGRPLAKRFQRATSVSAEPLLEVKGLARRGLFREVSFQLNRGEIVGLSGLIGAGRSELAQTLAGLYPATSGEVRIRGDLARIGQPRHVIEQGMVYVPEERRSQGLFLDFPLGWNISFSALQYLSRWGWVRSEREQALASSLYDLLGIRGAPLTAPVSALSGGNQQKVLLAKSLALEPDILLLDEPTRGVDVGAKAQIYQIIDDFVRGGKAVLMISSDLLELLSVCDRILVMREGRLNGEFSGPDFPVDRIGEAVMGVASC